MLDVVHKHKGGTMFFASVKSNADHFIYLSAYGQLASGLLEKYVADQRADNEELFAEWDKSFEEAKVQTGFSTAHEAEDGYVYISTFQDGIGITPAESKGQERSTTRGRYRDMNVSVLSPDLSQEISDMDTDDEQ